MGKHLSTFYKDDESEYCEIHVDLKEEFFYIKYYKKDAAKWFHTEEFIGKALRYVEDAAENWALGIKKIDPHYEGTLL
jgi:hypothetical protein